MRGGPGCCCLHSVYSLRTERPDSLCGALPALDFTRPHHPFSQSIQTSLLDHAFPQWKLGLQMVLSRRFKYYLYADNSQIYASSLDLSPGLQTCSSDCLFGISTEMFNSHPTKHSQSLADSAPDRTVDSFVIFLATQLLAISSFQWSGPKSVSHL